MTGAANLRGEDGSAVAVIPVRSGVLPVGGGEAIAEAGGRCWLVGSGCSEALAALPIPPLSATIIETASRPQSSPLATALAASLLERTEPAATVILPASPDGRDLAPQLAVALDRPLVAGAIEIARGWAVVARRGGSTMETVAFDGAVVATLQPGARNVPSRAGQPTTAGVVVESVELVEEPGGTRSGDRVELIAELPADPATMDLADAPRIVAGGAGLGTRDSFDGLHLVAEALGASVGATRVVTDQGWIPADRQIGTTGVTVDPDLYVAVGISGAVQHTAGLGAPHHIVVVNVDPSCPMMELADLAIVCDGPSFVDALGSALQATTRTPATPAGRREPVPGA